MKKALAIIVAASLFLVLPVVPHSVSAFNRSRTPTPTSTPPDKSVVAGAGDFVNIPIGTRHFFRNDSAEPVRMVLTFTPAGIEKFFEETLEPALDPTQAPPDNIAEVSARYAAAAPRYGMEFFVDAPV
jgi:hypothetical protein